MHPFSPTSDYGFPLVCKRIGEVPRACFRRSVGIRERPLFGSKALWHLRLARLIDWSAVGGPPASGRSIDRREEDGGGSDAASDDFANSDCDDPAAGAACDSGCDKATVADEDGSGLPGPAAATLAAHASRAKLVSKTAQSVLPDLSSSVAAIDELDDEGEEEEGDRTHTPDAQVATGSSSGRCHRDASVRSYWQRFFAFPLCSFKSASPARAVNVRRYLWEQAAAAFHPDTLAMRWEVESRDRQRSCLATVEILFAHFGPYLFGLQKADAETYKVALT